MRFSAAGGAAYFYCCFYCAGYCLEDDLEAAPYLPTTYFLAGNFYFYATTGFYFKGDYCFYYYLLSLLLTDLFADTAGDSYLFFCDLPTLGSSLTNAAAGYFFYSYCFFTGDIFYLGSYLTICLLFKGDLIGLYFMFFLTGDFDCCYFFYGLPYLSSFTSSSAWWSCARVCSTILSSSFYCYFLGDGAFFYWDCDNILTGSSYIFSEDLETSALDTDLLAASFLGTDFLAVDFFSGLFLGGDLPLRLSAAASCST